MYLHVRDGLLPLALKKTSWWVRMQINKIIIIIRIRLIVALHSALPKMEEQPSNAMRIHFLRDQSRMRRDTKRV